VVDSWRERERVLRRLGVEVDVISALRWDEGGTEMRLLPRPGEAVTGVRTWGRHPALFVLDPRPLWRALGERWDLLDLHEEPFALVTAEVLLLRALRRVPAPYLLYSAQNIDKRYPAPFRWLERRALRHAAGLSVCNHEAGRIAVRKGFPGLPRTIPLGIDTERFGPAASPRSTSHPDRIVVGYVGRLAPHKGVAVLLEAVAGDQRLWLRIAGDGPDSADLRRLARELGLQERAEFVGPVPQEDLPAFYTGLDVLAIPSLPTPRWLEQFGRVAVEAMACGVPVVASESGALPDVVGGVGTLVPPGEPAALRAALLGIGTDPAVAARARAAGLARAAECAWDHVGREYLAMYERALHVPFRDADRALDVVVVAYGSPDLLERALTPVHHLAVTVVDNSSSEGVRTVCSRLGVGYLDPGRNGGFAAGVNHALQRAVRPGADVLLLNPDAVISADAVADLHRALLADPDLASVAPAQVDPAGTPGRVGWPFPTPWGSCLDAIGLGRLRRRTDFAIGSVLLLRAEALAQVGGLDERFFLYAEETDWAYRASLLGWRHEVVEGITATHVGAGTSTDSLRREAHFHASQERYLRKHYGSGGWLLARLAQVIGSSVRSVVLPGDRARAARHRARLYLSGPVRQERRYRPNVSAVGTEAA
jgi:glycosyltransferase involved in cell wall biosynthesis/GT2 family glycosyltransferase